jgi:acetolactate synthase I/II/III large subunit
MLAEYTSEDCDLETVAEVLEGALWRAGVRHIPMIPGGPVMQFLEVVYARNRIKPILVRHEVNAVLMAEGYHRASGRIAATLVTAGPGATNTTTGVAVAFREQTPLICISAQVSSQHRGLDAAQELDTVALLTPITKASVEIADPGQLESTVNDLVALALSAPRGPVHISIPTNLWAQKRSWQNLTPSVQAAPPRVNQQHIDVLVEMLIAARKPVVLAGKGASDAGASELLVRLSKRLTKVKFAATPRAKGVFPETSASSELALN